tara:strand:- start:125 stop:463 length:339 start_codon:yes stop_codon:yes gene_type:complete
MGEQLSGNWRKQFDFRFLSGEDLESEVTVTIKSVTKESVHTQGGSEEVVAMWFENASKGVVLNKTNHKTISKVIGSPKYEHWIGKKIILHAAKVKAFGGMHTVVRVKMQKPQ